MMSINFSYNWNNKLQCHYYTTLRINSVRYTEGHKYEIQLKQKKIHVGRIMKIRLLNIDQINDYIGGLDTGYTAGECQLILKKMYKDKDLSKDILALLLIRNENWYMNLNEALSEEMNKVNPTEVFNLLNP